MKRIGLTGSIGTGKTTTAGLFAAEGVPVYDADAAVHALYASGGAAVLAVGEAFPGVLDEGRVDRSALSAAVFANPEALRRLEGLVHPLLAAGRTAFLAKAADAGADMVILDVPLLFETGGEKGLTAVVVTTCSHEEQRRRVLERPGMTPERLAGILARQVSDEEKRRRADFVVDTGGGLEAARGQVRAVLQTLRGAVA